MATAEQKAEMRAVLKEMRQYNTAIVQCLDRANPGEFEEKTRSAVLDYLSVIEGDAEIIRRLVVNHGV